MKKYVPEEPPAMLPKLRVTPLVGSVTGEVNALGLKYFSNVSGFCKDADVMRRELQIKGEFSLYSMMQLELKPTGRDLLEEKERVYVLCKLRVGEGGIQLRSCVGVKEWWLV